MLMTFKYDRKDFDCNYGDEADDQFALVFIVPEAIDRNAPAGSDMSFVKFDDCANIRREIVRDIHAGEVRRADDVRIPKEEATYVLFAVLTPQHIPDGWQILEVRYVRPGHPDEVIPGEAFEAWLERQTATVQ